MVIAVQLKIYELNCGFAPTYNSSFLVITVDNFGVPSKKSLYFYDHKMFPLEYRIVGSSTLMLKHGTSYKHDDSQ